MIEGWVNLVTAALLLFGVPTAVITTGAVVRGIATEAVRDQQGSRHTTSAVLLEDAPAAVPGAGGSGDRFPVNVRWSMPDGAVATGTAEVSAGRPRSSTTTVWLGRSGQQVSAPMTGGQVASLTVIAATAGGVVAGALLVIARGLIRRSAHRCRLAEWEQEWSQVGPVWGRHPA
ncbi:Rv1733c family protein [Streptomyces sp. H39-S7]|uniref:Rv1733c family protein n=1 Tax=Streptomyces sp. H39-S7 TaxID=3004357 RepID=UPI003FA6EAAD